MTCDDTQSRSERYGRDPFEQAVSTGFAADANSAAARSIVSRRAALRTLGLAGVAFAAGCTPLRIVLHDYPKAFDVDPDLTERMLRAFVLTVVPGADARSPDLARAFLDPDYPFARRAPFFAADLCRRSRNTFGSGDFDGLPPAQRTRVILDALNGDGTTRRLYGGAIFLARVSVFAGIYDDAHGCELIEFRGSRGLILLEDQTYPHPERFLAQGITADGNAA